MNRKDKLRVLFVLPSLVRAGAETQVVDLIQRFDRKQFEVFLFTFGKDLSQKSRLNEYAVVHYNSIRRHKFDFSLVRRIAQVVEQNDIDVVHTTLQVALLYGWIGCRLSQKRPLIVHALHKTVGRNKKEDYLERYLYQWPMRTCSRVICVCRNQEEFWHGKFPYLKVRSVVIYNGVDVQYFDREKVTYEGRVFRDRLGIPKTSPIIACIASLRPEKNHCGLIEAFSALDIAKLDPYLVLAGDGPEHGIIKKVVEELQLDDRIIFLGDVKDVRPLLAVSNMTVLNSVAIETFSIAMLESMSMSCPVISSDIGGHKEAITPSENGELIPVGDVTALRNTLNKCLMNKGMLAQMGLRARKTVEEKFSVEKMAKQTESIVKVAIRDRKQLY